MFRISFIFILGLAHCFAHSQTFNLEPIASNLKKPVDIASTYVANDFRLFVVEKDGKIRILDKTGSLLPEPFLDIDPRVNSTSDERGLLGLAFDPEYNLNKFFYVNYTNSGGNTVIARFKRLESDENKADPLSEKIILTINQPFTNHNGGDINFGPDGYLYIGMGDGGSGGDPGNRSQNPKELLGKMLRIDVKSDQEPYTVPPTNPFKNSIDTLPEIWALGLRNPWRFSFDRLNGDMWIADVGQNAWEEVNVEPKGQSGLNYGWRCYEGSVSFNLNGCNPLTKHISPVHSYKNSSLGCSITGGYVYRGTLSSNLMGKYIYTDFCSGRWWHLEKKENGTYLNTDLADLDNNEFSSLGERVDGELFVCGLSSGKIYQIKGVVSSNIHDQNLNLEIKIHPTIVDQTLYWTYELNETAIWSIIRTDGQILMSWNDLETNNIQRSKDIRSLVAGTYYLRLNKDKVSPKKFVKIQ